jgi:hypothetical protein
MRTMTARYNGRCAGCNNRIRRGETIGYESDRRLAFHERCVSDDTARQSVATTFSSGHTVYRNIRGPCEDAPCCGCCTF